MAKKNDVVEGEVLAAPPETQQLAPVQPYEIGASRAGMVALGVMSDEQFEIELQSAKRTLARLDRIISEVMEYGTDYTIAPGDEKKPKEEQRMFMLQAGAVQVNRLFKLVPVFDPPVVQWGDGVTAPSIVVFSRCKLHLGSEDGPVVGSGNGACSSWEKKYRYRGAGRECPECHKVGTVGRSKFPPRNNRDAPPGWWCNNKSGCGTDFDYADKRISEQQTGQIDNPDPHDQLETLIQMSDKRAMVKATRITTGADRKMSQDDELVYGEDSHGAVAEAPKPAGGQEPAARETPRAAAAPPPAKAQPPAQASMPLPQQTAKPPSQTTREKAAAARGNEPTSATQKMLSDLMARLAEFTACDADGMTGAERGLRLNGLLHEEDRHGVKYRFTEAAYQSACTKVDAEIQRRLAAGEKADDGLPF